MASRAGSARSTGSSVGKRVGDVVLLLGRKDTRSPTDSIAATSLAKALCAPPEVRVCVRAPPKASVVTSSLVTVLTTSG